MAQEHTFRFSQIPCSNGKCLVKFYTCSKIVNQCPFHIHWWKRQVVGLSKVGNIFSKPWMPSDNIFKAFWLVETRSLLILSKGFHLVIRRILSQTQR